MRRIGGDVMAELLLLLTWMVIGVAVELYLAHHERRAAWFAAAVLLGPLWCPVLADRQAGAWPEVDPEVDPARSADLQRGRTA